jgi:hypothetical protein
MQLNKWVAPSDIAAGRLFDAVPEIPDSPFDQGNENFNPPMRVFHFVFVKRILKSVRISFSNPLPLG